MDLAVVFHGTAPPEETNTSLSTRRFAAACTTRRVASVFDFRSDDISRLEVEGYVVLCEMVDDVRSVQSSNRGIGIDRS